jgi:hypothetical protein
MSEPTVPVPCSYHAPILVVPRTSDGEPVESMCGCGGISIAAAAHELARLRAMEVRARQVEDRPGMGGRQAAERVTARYILGEL